MSVSYTHLPFSYPKQKLWLFWGIPQLLYVSETWISKAKDISRIQGAEMRFLRSVKGCLLYTSRCV